MRDLPPALPPAERTVGQLVGETIRAYGDSFLRLLPLGLPLAVVDQLFVHRSAETQALILWAGSPFIVAAYVYACAWVHRARPTATAFLLGLLIFAPFPVLRAFYLLPAIAWLAFVGLAVPASLVERRGFRASLIRGRELGTADYIHALGSLATLVLVVGVANITLEALLHSGGGDGARAALFLADLVLTPLLFIGGALLYDDQAARIGSSSAHIRPPLDPDAAGRPDAEGQS
jgi:hypothetical protein